MGHGEVEKATFINFFPLGSRKEKSKNNFPKQRGKKFWCFHRLLVGCCCLSSLPASSASSQQEQLRCEQAVCLSSLEVPPLNVRGGFTSSAPSPGPRLIPWQSCVLWFMEMGPHPNEVLNPVRRGLGSFPCYPEQQLCTSSSPRGGKPPLTVS